MTGFLNCDLFLELEKWDFWKVSGVNSNKESCLFPVLAYLYVV